MVINAQRSRNLLAALLLSIGSTAGAESVWGVNEDLSTSDGDGVYCAMQTAWNDGRSLTIFFNQHGVFGFSIFNESWNLPQGTESFVTFSFGRGRENTFPVEAVDATGVIGDWNQADADQFIRRFTELWQMELVFPQGSPWPVGLNGSYAATGQWASCVQKANRLIENPPESDPFGSGGSDNPF